MQVGRVIAAALAIPALSLTAGCNATPKPEATASSNVEQAKLPSVGVGSNMTDAITEAHCAVNAKGVWSSTGVLKNTTKKTLSFDVTMFVGPSDGQTGLAHVTRINKVKPGKTAKWVTPLVETNFPAGPCHLQVRVAK